MLKNVLLAGAAIAALASVSVPARADNIVVNQWYAGRFTASNTPLLGGGNPGTHGPILPWPKFGNAIPAPVPAWVITMYSYGTLTVTDVETSGDRFQLFDNGVAMVPAASPFGPAPQNPGQASPGGGLTSVPVPNASFGVNDINAASIKSRRFMARLSRLGQRAAIRSCSWKDSRHPIAPGTAPSKRGSENTGAAIRGRNLCRPSHWRLPGVISSSRYKHHWRPGLRVEH